MAQFPQVGGVITKYWPKLHLGDGDSFPVARDTCAVCCGVYADDVEEETGEAPTQYSFLSLNGPYIYSKHLEWV